MATDVRYKTVGPMIYFGAGFVWLLSFFCSGHTVNIGTLYNTLISIDIGGALIPTILAIVLLLKAQNYYQLLGGVALAILLCFFSSTMDEIGPRTHLLIPVLIFVIFSFKYIKCNSANAGYCMGTLGAIIGADILNLSHIPELHADEIIIGGAGITDGVFVTGAATWALIVLSEQLLQQRKRHSIIQR